jgi:dipeptidyl aminopeptidase/acylaminoacyl peptidase
MKIVLIILISFIPSLSTNAQNGDTLTVKDYAHAESFLSYNTQKLIFNGSISPHWLSGDRFWYRSAGPQGDEFILVNPATGSRSAAFDQQKLAAAISSGQNNRVDGKNLPFSSIDFAPDGKSVFFQFNGKLMKCDLQNYKCSEARSGSEEPGKRRYVRKINEVYSPDSSKVAFIIDYNLWVKEMTTGKEKQLTTDGVQYYGYATDNAGWKSSDKPILRWSRDSKKIATFRQDERKAGDMYLISSNIGHPKLKAWKYPLPGDSNIIMIERVIINVDTPKVIRLKVPPDPHRGSLSDDISSSGTFDDVDWSPDDSQLAFVSTSRDHKQEKFRIANAVTGAVREVFEETVPTQFESGQGAINWRYLPNSGEIIWYSERDNWGHLYLYDAITGKAKNKITVGDYVVTRLLKVDEKNHMLYFLADGLDLKNPYFTHLYKVSFDGKQFISLTPEEGNHTVTFCPSERYFIDSYSQPDVPPVIVLRNTDGKIVSPLEKTDISRLVVTGWQPPKPFTVKSHDGQTDLYGLQFTPANMDTRNKYPIIDYIYPGPQGGSVGSWSFVASRNDNQALAELGFVVIELEGTSNPLRSKSFHDISYGDMAENTLPDQVLGIRQLAQRYSYIDTNRIGIWGHSGGGFATAAAMFRYPNFFKVGISESGNHDNRNYEDDWGERYIGLEAFDKNGVSNYESQANQLYAKNLKGKLMLAHGMMDDNVPPTNTMLVIEALERANKDYDLVIFPNSRHGYGAYAPYMMRRRWDYFVRNLLGKEPPKEYQFNFPTYSRYGSE